MSDNSRVHSILLQMLKEIDGICQKYDISYYVAGGTTIGAVRHRGFIPWDDDADIYMTRSDFARFREAFKKEQPADRALECPEDNPSYPATVPRYVATSTTNIAKFNVLDTCAGGLVIDIFLLDPISSDPEEQRKQRNLLYIYSDFVNPYLTYSYRCDDDFLGEYARYKAIAEEIGKDEVRRDLERRLFSREEEGSDYYMLRWGTLSHIFPKEMFGKPYYVPFEDTELPVPTRWYEYLSQLYGVEWYNFPRNISEQGHLFVTNLDLPYEVYLKDADPYLDREKLLGEMIKRKDLLLQKEDMRRPHLRKILDVKARYAIFLVNKAIEKSDKTPKELFGEKRYDEIKELFQPYTELQFSTDAIGALLMHTKRYRFYNPVFFPLDDENLSVLLRTMLMTDGISRVRRLFEVMDCSRELTPPLLKVREEMDGILDVIREFYAGDHQKALDLIEKLPEDMRGSNLIVNRLRMLLAAELTPETLTEEEIIRTAEKFDDDIEIQKALADYYWQKGEKDKAEEIYRRVCDSCNNGILLLDIRDKTGLVPEGEASESDGDDGSVGYDDDDDEKAQPEPEDGRNQREFQLLVEVDELCRKEGIQYSVTRRTLMYGVSRHQLPPGYNPPEVMMTGENAKKFLEAFEREAPEGRALKHMANTDGHFEYTILYCDTNTAKINLRTSECDNLFLRILILEQPVSGKWKKKWNNWIEKTAFVDSTKREDRPALGVKGSWGHVVGTGSKVIKAFNGGSAFYDKLFQRKLNAPDTGGDYIVLTKNFGRHRRYTLPHELFDEMDTVEIYGHDFSVVSDWRTYAIRVYKGTDVDSLFTIPRADRLHMIIDLDNSLEEVMDVIGHDLGESEEQIRFDESWLLDKEGRKAAIRSNAGFRVMLRTDARIMLAEEYLPLKEKILSLDEAQDMDELGRVLEDYDQKAREFNAQGLAIYFDEDIYRAYTHYLESRGEDEFIKLIQDHIEKEGLKPLEPIKQREGE